MVLSGTGELDIYEDCNFERYHASIYSFDGCVRMYRSFPTRSIKVVGNTLAYPQPQPIFIPPNNNQLPVQEHIIKEIKNGENSDIYNNNNINSDDCPHYVIIYSCESSRYFGYQTQSNYYGFLTSKQHKNGHFLRLLTSSKIDDMASYIPTYTIKRHPYSRRYQPLNKGDSLFKWYESPLIDSYFEENKIEIISVIDPDNWIIRDISKWIKQVKKGHALGEAAWFHGNSLVTKLWKEVCLKNCDFELDLVGVPYFIHKDDLKLIVPWFRKYILIIKDKEENQGNEWKQQYKDIQLGWGTEMFAYIFGAAHVGIKHEIIRGAQIRDVSERPKNREEELSISMIHMGRIWFPYEYKFGQQWWHTEGKAWKRFGAQVWCKCNWTASDIIPWPMPDNGMDFQSYHSLYLLHESRQYFGEMLSCEMRHKGEHGYGWSYP